MSNASINLTIDSDRLHTFYEQLIKRSRNLEKTHDSLITLETFISRFCTDSQGSDQYRHIISIMQKHSDKSRAQLLSQKADLLAEALRSMNICAVTDIYLPLSRNGFYEILKNVIDRFTELELSVITEWAQQWLSYNKHKAEAASGYPDAADFKKAGIDAQQYQAMLDVERLLSSLALA